jgi:hypothetical protein
MRLSDLVPPFAPEGALRHPHPLLTIRTRRFLKELLKAPANSDWPGAIAVERGDRSPSCISATDVSMRSTTDAGHMEPAQHGNDPMTSIAQC